MAFSTLDLLQQLGQKLQGLLFILVNHDGLYLHLLLIRKDDLFVCHFHPHSVDIRSPDRIRIGVLGRFRGFAPLGRTYGRASLSDVDFSTMAGRSLCSLGTTGVAEVGS
jgi:hypothetical protein